MSANHPMNVEAALLGRRTVHEWLPAVAPPGLRARLLAAAHQAPCHKLTWPWRFLALGPQTRAALIPLAVAEKEGKHGKPLIGPLRDKIAAMWTSPMEVFAVSQVLAADPLRREEDYAAVACAIQNIQLLAHGLGLGAKWSTGPLTRAPAALALLGVDPEVERCVGYVFVGLPARVGEVPRPPLEGFVRALP
ncbi:MAG: nitroreductase family protein [Deltaproteobacteria bacterium]|jgi:nitroreductase|nr:nitroreductase family protein [Deltaproteobacteria bacterium]